MKVAYIHGRPNGHPIHAKIAKAVNSDFFPVDFKIRWHDVPSIRIRRYLSWIVCALTFPQKKNYDVFFAEDAYYFPVIMRFFGLIKKQQKIVVLMASHTLYFLYIGHYSKSTSIALKILLRSYDAIVCIGETQYFLAQEILGKDHNVKIYKIYNGVPEERFDKLLKVSPSFYNKNIVFIGNIENEDRAKYKGIDLMLQGFSIAKQSLPVLEFKIVGNCNFQLINEMIEKFAPRYKSSIKLLGSHEDIAGFLANSSLYLHCARGDAFPTTVMEALASGLPTLVSEWVGNKSIVSKVDPRLVVPIEPEKIAEKILWYFDLPNKSKHKLSEKCKVVIREYTEKNALIYFEDTFNRMYSELSDSPTTK